VIIDGNKGLRAAVERNWLGIEVQRCTVHKLRDLERHVPRHALEEVKSNYHRIIQAESLEQASKA
jgi:transposase-like protein